MISFFYAKISALKSGLIIVLIIAAILLLGDDLIEWLFCDDMALIWIVLLILLLTNFGFDGGCC